MNIVRSVKEIVQQAGTATRVKWLEFKIANLEKRIENLEQYEATTLTILKGIPKLMSTVADLTTKLQTLADAQASVTAALTNLKTTLDASVADIKAEVDALKNSQPSLDLTSLDASIASAQASVASIQAVVDEAKAADPGPVPPAPPVNP